MSSDLNRVMVHLWQIEEVEKMVFVLQSRSANANAGTDFRHLPAVALPLARFLGRHDLPRDCLARQRTTRKATHSTLDLGVNKKFTAVKRSLCFLSSIDHHDFAKDISS